MLDAITTTTSLYEWPILGRVRISARPPRCGWQLVKYLSALVKVEQGSWLCLVGKVRLLIVDCLIRLKLARCGFAVWIVLTNLVCGGIFKHGKHWFLCLLLVWEISSLVYASHCATIGSICISHNTVVLNIVCCRWFNCASLQKVDVIVRRRHQFLLTFFILCRIVLTSITAAMGHLSDNLGLATVPIAKTMQWITLFYLHLSGWLVYYVWGLRDRLLSLSLVCVLLLILLIVIVTGSASLMSITNRVTC